MNEIELLIADGRRIATFGMRAGLLGDTKLYEALAKVDAAKTAGTITWDSEALTELQNAVDAAVKKIAPVTLVDLNSGWDPFKAPPPSTALAWHQRLRTHLSKGKLHAASLAATIVLIFTAGYYTLWHARATELMKFTLGDSIEEQEVAVRRMLLPLLVTIVPPAPAVAVATPASTADPSAPDAVIEAKVSETPAVATAAAVTAVDGTRLDLLMETTVEVQKLQRAIARYQQRFDALYRDRIIGWGQWSDWNDYWQKRANPDLPPDPQQVLNKRIADLGAFCTPEREAGVVQAFAGQTGSGVKRTAEALVNVDALRRCFLDALGVSPLTIEAVESPDMEKRLFEFEHALGIVGNWLLPAVYGALGALVYYMRQFVNPLRPDPSASRVIMRVSLGALAGILLAWFWTTTTVEEGLTIPDVGLGTLALAFIVGFSIEVFFGLLDRLVQMANQAVQRLGTAG